MGSFCCKEDDSVPSAGAPLPAQSAVKQRGPQNAHSELQDQGFVPNMNGAHIKPSQPDRTSVDAGSMKPIESPTAVTMPTQFIAQSDSNHAEVPSGADDAVAPSDVAIAVEDASKQASPPGAAGKGTRAWRVPIGFAGDDPSPSKLTASPHGGMVASRFPVADVGEQKPVYNTRENNVPLLIRKATRANVQLSQSRVLNYSVHDSAPYYEEVDPSMEVESLRTLHIEGRVVNVPVVAVGETDEDQSSLLPDWTVDLHPPPLEHTHSHTHTRTDTPDGWASGAANLTGAANFTTARSFTRTTRTPRSSPPSPPQGRSAQSSPADSESDSAPYEDSRRDEDFSDVTVSVGPTAPMVFAAGRRLRGSSLPIRRGISDLVHSSIPVDKVDTVALTGEIVHKLRAQMASLAAENEELKKQQKMAAVMQGRDPSVKGLMLVQAEVKEAPSEDLKEQLAQVMAKLEILQHENERLRKTTGKAEPSKNSEAEYDALVKRQIELIMKLDAPDVPAAERKRIQQELDEIEQRLESDLREIQDKRERELRLAEHLQLQQKSQPHYESLLASLTKEDVHQSPLCILIRHPQLLLTRAVADTRQLCELHELCSLRELLAIYYSVSAEMKRRGLSLEGNSKDPRMTFTRDFVTRVKALIQQRQDKRVDLDVRPHRESDDPMKTRSLSIQRGRYADIFEKGDQPSAGANEHNRAPRKPSRSRPLQNDADASKAQIKPYDLWRDTIMTKGWAGLTDEELKSIVNTQRHTAIGAPSVDVFVRLQKVAQVQINVRLAARRVPPFQWQPERTDMPYLRECLAAFGGVVGLSDDQLQHIAASTSPKELGCSQVEFTSFIGQAKTELKARQRFQELPKSSDVQLRGPAVQPRLKQSDAIANQPPSPNPSTGVSASSSGCGSSSGQADPSALDPDTLGGFLVEPGTGVSRSYPDAAALMSIPQLNFVVHCALGDVGNIPSPVAHGMLQRAAKAELSKRGAPIPPRPSATPSPPPPAPLPILFAPSIPPPIGGSLPFPPPPPPPPAPPLPAGSAQGDESGDASVPADCEPEVLGRLMEDDDGGGHRNYKDAARLMTDRQLRWVAAHEFGCVAGVPNVVGFGMLQRACKQELKSRAL